MNFGEALRYELIQIEKLNNKVFPIIAPQGSNAPFLVYQRDNAEYITSLSGVSSQVSATYTLSIQTNSYAEKEELEELIKDKLLSFSHRTIGDSNGPYIQRVNVSLLSETYIHELNIHSSGIRIEVNY